VTLRNDRHLRASSDAFVRNGDRWLVTDTFADGSIRVAPTNAQLKATSARSEVMLPPAYVRENVALGYALTVHKAQGTTTDRAVVIVEENMTAPQLYVAMTRGKEENHALVVTSDRSPEDHGHQPSVDALELLGTVMRRDTPDLSAHDVMRRSLATSENVSLLRELAAEADQFITQGAPPDHSREIEALTPRADLGRANFRLTEAEQALRAAEARRLHAEAAVSEAERRSLRARLPGRSGEEARAESASARAGTTSELATARRDERSALKAFDASRHGLDEAQRSAVELNNLQVVEEQRQRWLDGHLEEVQWAKDLHVRLEERTTERHHPTESRPRPEVLGGPRELAASQGLPHSVSTGLEQQEREILEPIEHAPTHLHRQEPESEYPAAPEPPTLPRDMGGPSIGR